MINYKCDKYPKGKGWGTTQGPHLVWDGARTRESTVIQWGQAFPSTWCKWPEACRYLIFEGLMKLVWGGGRGGAVERTGPLKKLRIFLPC